MKLIKKRRNALRELEDVLRKKLVDFGFIEVATPTIIPKEYILRMGITENDPLWHQIIWTYEGKCLRPMLAPNLYYLMKKLEKLYSPVKIFEIGSCFRKERGQNHLTEFTMCNAVIYPIDSNNKEQDFRNLIRILMNAVEIYNYDLEEKESKIYGKTLDVVFNGLELGSTVAGPVDIDLNWKVSKPWVGVGIGLKRILMVKNNSKRIAPFSKSLEYLNGHYTGWL